MLPVSGLCNILINGAVRSGQLQMAMQQLQFMDDNSIDMDDVTISTILLPYCEIGDSETVGVYM